MDLILWRHAEAEDGTPDDARALTAKGIRQAQRMASWLKRRVRGGVTLIASPALRARQTAEAYGGRVQTCESIGLGASAARILKAAQWPDVDGTVILVGHQPALGAAAALALTGHAASWPIKKGAVWWLRSKGGGSAIVVAVLAPRHARDR